MKTDARDSTASLLARFSAQVRRRADAPAAIEAERSLSYRELEARSDAMAALLRARGAGPGERVVLLAGRSLETLVAMLAILKTGAAYAPIDLDYPRAAQAIMLADAAPTLVLAARGADVAACAAPTLELEALEEACAQAPRAQSCDGARDGAAPAYVMFTSGSTGRPKGVVVPDRAILRLVIGQSYAPIHEDDVLLHASPIAFDASTFEVWGALLNGARVSLLRAARPSVEEIVETCRRDGVTIAWFTAGLFHLLAERGVERLGGLRRLLAGGDVVSAPHLERARASLPRMTFVNGYGPTENTTFSCCHVIAPGEPTPRGAVPIGRAIAGSTAYVVDEDMRRLGDGEAGELCVGGEGLALGYLGAPELTAQRFVTAPWGERLYRTGDVVTRAADGAHHFHGRVDRQVKINGKRVELDALEDALRGRADARDAAVLLDERAGKRLVAVVKRAPGADVARLAQDGMDALRALFPASILPGVVAVTDEFPLTPNGKLDRAALLARTLENDCPAPARVATAQAPRDDAVERAVAEVFETILKRAPLPRDVNFFDLGATSLHLIAAQDALRERLGVDAPVTLLFERPDIARLARALRAARGETAPIASRGESDLSRARQRAAALKQLAARGAAGAAAARKTGDVR